MTSFGSHQDNEEKGPFLTRALRFYDGYRVKVAWPAKVITALLCIPGALLLSWCMLGTEPNWGIRLAEGALGTVLLTCGAEFATPGSHYVLRLQNVLGKQRGERLSAAKEEWRLERIEEHIKWCKNVFSDFADYPGYWGESELKKCSLASLDVQEGIRRFSFGMIAPDARAYTIPASFSDDEDKAEWEELCEKERQKASDLASIWTYAIAPAKIPSSAWSKKDSFRWWQPEKDTRVDELGERLGIKEMVKAYVEGVPISDILV